MDHINDILPEFKIEDPNYASRRFLQGESWKNYRNEDKYPDHVLGTYTPHVPVKKEPKIISYDDFLYILRENYKKYAKFKKWPEIVMHPDNVEVIYQIVGQVVSSEKNKKGIYLVGDHGTGKTEFFNVLLNTVRKWAFSFDNLQYIYTHRYDQIYDDIRITGSPAILYNMRRTIYIDDFLYQNRVTAKVWGNTDNVADLVITRCYELFKEGHSIYMTSNYGPKFMEENQYIHKGSADRMHEMMTMLTWSGDSLRRK